MKEIVAYNNQDSIVRIPYGQARFEGASNVDLTLEELISLNERIHNAGKQFFDTPMLKHQLDVILSIDNRNAGYAAAAKYPCLTIPMGYTDNGQPTGLTFIARPYEEDKLLKIGYAFEQATKSRIMPDEYK
jgi:amidase